MIINLDSLSSMANSDLISGLANISQFYNIYQSTKAANYAEMVSELQKQNYHIDSMFDMQTQEILNKVIEQTHEIIEQNKLIIKQNEEIISILKGRDNL